MKLDLNKPVFGETAYEDNRQVVWTEKYEASRKNAAELCEKFNLDPLNDFWIKKYASQYDGKIIYENLIIRHASLVKINDSLPSERKFKPSCVSEARGADGGVAFVYKSDEQGLFKTGEATPINAGCSYLYAVAEKRLFDRVVIALANLEDIGIFTEIEDDIENAKPLEGTVKNADKERIKALEEQLAATKSNMDKLFKFYNVNSLEELSQEQLKDCEEKAQARLELLRKSSEKGKAITPAKATATESKEAKALADKLIKKNSAAETKQSTLFEEDSFIEGVQPVGETIFQCSEDAPLKFKSIAGKSLDEIGITTLKPLFARSNSAGRKYVNPVIAAAIDLWIVEQTKPEKQNIQKQN